MKKSLLMLLCFTLTAWAGLPNMAPLVEHLRTLPASVHGEVYLTTPRPIQDDDKVRVSLRANRNVRFNFDEDGVYVNLTGALNMCVKTWIDLNDGCLQVDVHSVRWDPATGFQADLQMASYDLWGVIAGNVKRNLEATLNAQFGAKMERAMGHIRRFRQSRNLAETQAIARAMGEVFTGQGSGTLPDFGGRVGVTFEETCRRRPPSYDTPIHIAGVRIGLPCEKDVTLETSFFHNRHGFDVTRLSVRSNGGINLNEGHEFRANQRLIIHELNLDAQGIESNVTIGASETVMGLIALLEVVSQSSGNPPSQICQLCELARLTPFTTDADLLLRENVRQLVVDNQAGLRNLGVTQQTIRDFLHQENCRIQGMHCQKPCRIEDDADKERCIARCVERYQACGGD